MQFSNLPAKITTPFANSGSKRTIPIASQIGITAGAASYTDGFPPLTFTPLASGGVPPAGQDFNGVLNAITLIQQWQSAGGNFVYDSAWSSANGGYPKGAVLLQAGGAGFWLCLVDNNTSNPDTGTPTGWAPLDAAGVTAVTGLAASNVTLTPAQYGLPIITLAGTLTANVQVIFPAIAGTQWLIVNNTTGLFTVTAKTSAGAGAVLPNGGASTSVWGDGTNLASSGSGRFLSRQVITTTGVITPPSGASFGNCTVVGGGGGGGGGATGVGASQCASGAGGGGAGWAIKRIPVASLSGATATVGAGGAGGVNSAAGGNGGTSSIGALVTGGGGSGGTSGNILTNTITAPNGFGQAGVGTLGDMNFLGTYGLYALYGPSPISGKGGASFFGDGAPGATAYSSGNNAIVYGAGGSGGNVPASNGGGATGGTGMSGAIVIDWYQ